MHIPNKIISGGQTGADLGGLVGARRAGIPTGGTAPKDFKTEVGNKPDELKAFGVVEHFSPDYTDRTRENVLNSDATIIFATDSHSAGTLSTIKFCRQLDKPFLVVAPEDESIVTIKMFLSEIRPSVLNIAGNRESKSKGLTSKTASIIQQLFHEA